MIQLKDVKENDVLMSPVGELAVVDEVDRSDPGDILWVMMFGREGVTVEGADEAEIVFGHWEKIGEV